MQEDTPESVSPLRRLMTRLQIRQNQASSPIPEPAVEEVTPKVYRRIKRKKKSGGSAMGQGLRNYNKRRGRPDTIEEYREKFRHAPLGRWISSLESGPWPTEAWEFHADGTGKLFEYSGSGNNVILFEWQPEAEHTVKLRVTDWGNPPVTDWGEESWDAEEDEAEETSDAEPMRDKASEENSWGFIGYDFKTIDYYGPQVVLFQVPASGRGLEQCQIMMTYDLHFAGDIKAESQPL